jgi:cellulose synthase operon protein YhjU
MGIWSFYFFGKLLLYVSGHIDFHILPNLAFASFLILPLRRSWLRVLRQIIAIPTGAALLYYDSWLPPLQRLMYQAGNLQQFDAVYLVELLGRFVNPRVVALLFALLLLNILLSRKLRMSTFAIAAILLVPPINGFVAQLNQSVAPAQAVDAGSSGATAADTVTQTQASGDELNTILANFYQTESTRKVAFSPAVASNAPYDLVLLHICSLAWDDMAYVHLKDHPLMGRFDLVFSNFNSAASYSGPAAIRILRGPCGQEEHENLYQKTEPECYLFNQLQQAGFKPEYLMGHDGHFGNFIDDVRKNGGLDVPLQPVDQVPVAMRAFDGSPIYDDYAELSHWWQQRLKEPDSRVALYYNTMSLHDGNRLLNSPSLSSVDSYHARLDKLLGDVDKFLQQLSSSGRRVVVVFIPEHGAALRGDKLQISGLREIPSPAISLVPVGIKLIGMPQAGGAPLIVSQPSSYLAVTQLLANFAASNPFESPAFNIADYARDLPQTEYVAENEGAVVMRQAGRYMMRNPDKSWTEYPKPAP